MKALITSGGRGTRLRPITHTNNKHLIPIANKPMLFYALEAVVEAGIKEVGVVVGSDTKQEIIHGLGNGNRWGISIIYIEQDEPRGLAHAVKISESFIGKDSFIFYLGDNMVVGGVKRFIKEFETYKPNCQLVLARVKNPQRFGVPELRDGKIISIEEKPANPKSPYAVTGLYIYDSTIFEAVNNICPSARGELEISDAHQYLLDKGLVVRCSEITGWWKDTGEPEDLLEANRLVLDRAFELEHQKIEGEANGSDIAGKVIIGKGTKISNSIVRGPVIIGENTFIKDSYIGPYTSIHHTCEICNSEVEYSILMEYCKIINVDIRIERSLLGRGASIVRCTGRPRSHRFLIGDQSKVEVV
ncbi:MAG TPA: glucose-1-phosphate thymidylyltransferase [Candidatus Eremiobacteraeota bacterium]|nr:MAG: Glucose-1-phosphate thymidylyltransferase [bacterium ADurb.Bin363]HPZ10011.1 glucose-1-phosphate thymidylyltransferase [Candidatus Eremiobacteraeota bacterium]